MSELAENSDRNNVRVFLDDTRLSVHWVGAPDAAGVSQTNAAVPGSVPKGERMLCIECGGVSGLPPSGSAGRRQKTIVCPT